jgi:glutaredoxin
MSTDHVSGSNNPAPEVTIYTSSDCRWCGPAKQYLSDNGISFVEKSVEQDESVAREALTLSGGRQQTPIIAVGSNVVVGFQRRELAELLGLDGAGTSES